MTNLINRGSMPVLPKDSKTATSWPIPNRPDKAYEQSDDCRERQPLAVFVCPEPFLPLDG